MENALASRSVAVLGAGIGGLTAALCCARRGAHVTVYEQAPALTEVGAGLQITPNGARVLEALGLDLSGAIQAEAVTPMDAVSGRQITRYDLTGLSGPSYRFFHRADLLSLLANACDQSGVRLRLGHKVDFTTGRGLPDWSGEDPYLIVGAEGIHSAQRRLLNGDDAPFFTGQVAWRAVIPQTDAAPVARIWMAPGRHMVTYPLTGGRLNVVAVQERAAWRAEGWSHQDDPANLRRAFGNLSGRVRGVLEAVETVHIWGLFRHPVATRWHGDRSALVGDAAHPTLPFLAQGANLAIEDAWVLAASVASAPLEQALPAYQALRRPRVSRAIAVANRNTRNYHLRGPQRRAAHLVLSTAERVAPGALLKRLSWLYDHDVTAGR